MGPLYIGSSLPKTMPCRLVGTKLLFTTKLIYYLCTPNIANQRHLNESISSLVCKMHGKCVLQDKIRHHVTYNNSIQTIGFVYICLSKARCVPNKKQLHLIYSSCNIQGFFFVENNLAISMPWIPGAQSDRKAITPAENGKNILFFFFAIPFTIARAASLGSA